MQSLLVELESLGMALISLEAILVSIEAGMEASTPASGRAGLGAGGPVDMDAHRTKDGKPPHCSPES